MKFLVLNGPNINMLGLREPELYGTAGYADLQKLVQERAAALQVEIKFLQSNHEGDLVDAIQQAYWEGMDGIILNAAAYTHTSVAVLDALQAVRLPVVEVHITDPDRREEFRRVNFVRPAAVLTIAGHGLQGYVEALDFLVERVGHLCK